MKSGLTTSRIIITGFAGIIFLVGGLVAIGLSRLAEINAQMDEIANHAYARSEAVFTMRIVARERLIGLQSMFFITDPFDRDDERMRYNSHALRFIKARDALLTTGLSTEEQGIWDDARRMIQADEQLHADVLDLLFSGNAEQAGLMVRQSIIPLESQLLDRLNSLLDISRNHMQAKLDAAAARYRQTFMLMVFLSLATLLGVVATAAYVVRRTARTEDQLRQEKQRVEQSAEKLSWAAHHDPLTGLPNRRVFEVKLEALMRNAREGDGRHTLAYVDLDRFKQINDTWGHAVGDELLMAVASIMRENLRDGDTLTRLGGDEFGLLLQDCPVDEAERLVARIRQNVEEFCFPWQGQSLRVGLSVGLVAIDPAVQQMAELVREADAACYRAKEKSRQRRA